MRASKLSWCNTQKAFYPKCIFEFYLLYIYIYLAAHFNMSPKYFTVAAIYTSHYSLLLSRPHCALVISDRMNDCNFTHHVSEYPLKWCTYSTVWLLHHWCHVKLLPPVCTVVYTIQPCTSLQCHFTQNHTHRVHACLAITSHLHF